MKKFILGLFLFFLAPFIVQAVDYDITDQLIQAEIKNNGDLLIKELIVMDGTFNGYEKSLSYANAILSDNIEDYANNSLYNAKGLTLISIKGKYVNSVDFATMNDLDFNTFNKTIYASNGDYYKYTESSYGYGNTYRLYHPANNNRVAFLIEYLIDSAVVLHEDVAELYWNFISPNDYDAINNVKVKVILPNNDNSDNFKLWLHGSLAGEIRKVNNREVLATYDYMTNSDVLDIRITFDKNLITDISKVKKSNVNALEKILKVETERADIANNLRKELKNKRNFVIYGTLLIYISIIGLSLLIYFKYGKSPKSNYYSKYNREFIDDYNVEVIDYLMNKKITPNAMSASIMNLVYKKNLTVEEIPSKKKHNYDFTLENRDNLNESENILVDFLFDRVGKNRTNETGKKMFSTIDLKEYASGTKTCTTFINSYTKWKNNVLKQGKEEKFYERSNTPIIFGIIILMLTIIIFTVALSYGVDFIFTYLLLFFAIIFFIYTLLIDRKTIKGAEHFAKWKAFKNFLNDFGSFELKELPEIVLWERYLVYATIFGLAQKLQKDMNVRISEMNIDTLNYDYYPSFVYINLGNSINSSISNAVNSAYSRQSANYANTHSSFSSGGGFGGGASSGGGFGGGGSSGHGF